jgi:hypothetical protein
MAVNSRFKIRRSTTYNGAVSAIPAAVAELVHITTNANNYVTRVGHKLYVGVGTEIAGQASEFESIGGQYYTQLLDGVAGVLNPSAAIITDANSRISGLNIASAGTLALNNTANTFSTTIKAAPGLAANYALTLPTVVGSPGQALLTDGTGILSWGAPANNINSTIPLNTTAAYVLADTGANTYLQINTNTGANAITIGNIITTQGTVVKPNTTAAYTITDGTNTFLRINTTTVTPLTILGFGNVDVTNTLTVTGGVLATGAATSSVFNTVATTLSIGGAATSVSIGAATGTTTVNNGLFIGLGSITTLATTASVFNTTAITLNIGGAATVVNIGAVTGTTTVRNNLAVTGGGISTTALTASVFNTTATTVNLAGAATTVTIGAGTGTTSVNNNLVVAGNLTVSGTTTTFNAVNVSVQDSIIQQGLVGGAAPTVATTFDLGAKYSYFDTTAKNSAFFFQRTSRRFVLANNSTEAASVISVATPTISNTDYAPLVLGSLYLNDEACSVLGTAEPVIAYRTNNGVTGRFLDGVILDAGIF